MINKDKKENNEILDKKKEKTMKVTQLIKMKFKKVIQKIIIMKILLQMKKTIYLMMNQQKKIKMKLKKPISMMLKKKIINEIQNNNQNVELI